MTGILVLLGVGVVQALIARPSSSEARRWALTRSWSWLLAAAMTVVAFIAVASRGLSRSSVAIVGLTVFLLGLEFMWAFDSHIEEVRGKEAKDTQSELRVRVRRVPQPFVRNALFFLCIVMAAWMLVPLRYAGALVHDKPLAAISRVVSFKKFEPLRDMREISAGQCLESRDPRRRNVVVPCSRAHRAEVVATVDAAAQCPELGALELADEGLLLQVVPLVIGSAKYCVLQSKSATRPWIGPLSSKSLAPTS